VLVAALALLFAAVTHHVWEDYYITYRPSKNLVEGHGLVFQPGERVHTFTSPVNVLLPAVFALVTGNRSDDLVLWLYRLASAAALGGTAVLILGAVQRAGLGSGARAVLVALLCLDLKTVDFAMNGQEAGFMVFFMALAVDALTGAPRRPILRLALAFAGLMWTRPDGFIYASALVLAAWLFSRDGVFAGFRGLRPLAAATSLGAALYLPWFVWAWSYYGTPVPHTVLAKRALEQTQTIASLAAAVADFPRRVVEGTASTSLTFLPLYMDRGGWDQRFTYPFNVAVGILCTFYWVWPRGRRLGRLASLAFMACHVYLTVVVPYAFPWYLPTSTLLALVVLAVAFQDSLDLARRLELRSRVLASAIRVSSTLAGTIVLAFMAAFYAGSVREIRVQQRLIEDGNRKQIGLFLKQNARTPLDTVFLEPLGYIGFFSGLKMYDFPGLASPEVVAARWRLNTNLWAPLIRELRPDWLVLRPGEMYHILRTDSKLLADYATVRVFDQRAAIAREKWLPGRPYLAYDSQFWVLRRRITSTP
jgi:hypothetical protein